MDSRGGTYLVNRSVVSSALSSNTNKKPTTFAFDESSDEDPEISEGEKAKEEEYERQ